jgi:uncharacterized protein (TIGR02118 family)
MPVLTRAGRNLIGEESPMTRIPRRDLLAATGGLIATAVAASLAPPARSQEGETAMARMLVIYRTPKDAAAFDRHYFGIHVPLAKKLPGLRKYEVSHGPIALLGNAADTYFVATLHFDSLADIRAAFATPEGQACAADRKKFASDEDVEIFLFDNREI